MNDVGLIGKKVVSGGGTEGTIIGVGEGDRIIVKIFVGLKAVYEEVVGLSLGPDKHWRLSDGKVEPIE